MNSHTQSDFSTLAKASALAVLFLLCIGFMPAGTDAAVNNRASLEGGGGGGGGGGIDYQCSDGVDNDGNGLTDYLNDPGCSSSSDISESGYTAATACTDGVDNDGNGVTDYPSDLGCTSAADTSESGYTPPPQCNDGTDNDGNGVTDYPNDQGCSSSSDTTESGYTPQCKDNIDNDGNGVKDYPSDGGCTSAIDATESGYVPPPAPPPGVIVYKTQSKRDFLNKVYKDQLDNGGYRGEYTAAHGYPQYPVTTVSPTGTRICYLYDPTAYITEWSLGGFSNPDNDSMGAWDPSLKKWYVRSANSFGNKRYNYLTCKTLAAPDTSLTATANGTTGTNITVAAGTPVTLTWKSQYGQIRKGTFTSTNFDLTTTIPGHWGTQVNFRCSDTGGDIDDGNVYYNQASVKTGLLALSTCYDEESVWVPESTAPRPYGGTKVVTPSTTTTYTYKGTNANGSTVSSVTVTVTGELATTECSDTLDNDGDQLIDLNDPGCTGPEDTTESDAVVPQCTDDLDNDDDGLTDEADPGCATDPENPNTNEGSAPTLSCSVDPANVTVGGTATYTATVSGGSGSYTYDWTPQGGQTCTGTGNTRECTFASAGYYQMHLDASGNGRLSCDFSAVNVAEVCSPSSVTISVSPERVAPGGSATVTWAASEGCSCTITGSNGFSASTPSGSALIENVTKQTTFTTSCSGTTQSALLNLTGRFQEF
ncbi:MAG TPA: hypothetical protein VEB18_00205 [Candidatus Paceibacterota bacterium]|nr:hypothetical protein [Candidatus Paceibacterota bacterium]